jgi:hypothetical protein
VSSRLVSRGNAWFRRYRVQSVSTRGPRNGSSGEPALQVVSWSVPLLQDGLACVLDGLDGGAEVGAVQGVRGCRGEGSIRVGDAPAEPVGLERRGGTIPRLGGAVVRAGSERCGEVARKIIALELVDALRGGVLELSGERGVGGLQLFDVLGVRQAGESPADLVQFIVEDAYLAREPECRFLELVELSAIAEPSEPTAAALDLSFEHRQSVDGALAFCGQLMTASSEGTGIADVVGREPGSQGPPLLGEVLEFWRDGFLHPASGHARGEACSWVVGLVDVVVVDLVEVLVEDGLVETVCLASAGEGDVAPLAVEGLGAEDVGVVDGESLGFVAGDGVAVGDVAGVEVVAG